MENEEKHMTPKALIEISQLPKKIRRIISTAILVTFIGSSVSVPRSYAADVMMSLSKPGAMVHMSPVFNPPVLKGIRVHPENPFQFDFILDKGDSTLGNEQLKEESKKLIKYFLASLTIPEKDLWVNLSPYERDRIVPESFGLTEMGRDLLAQDYILKQITASLIYPEEGMGKIFWKRIYEEAAKKYGTTNIPVNTFNKVWIIPETAVVYENAQAATAYVVESKLKVMLEEDYLSLNKHTDVGEPLAGASNKAGASPAPTDVNQIGSQIVREIVIPQLTKEINENKNFAQLRQVYNSLILATWYKKKIKDSILTMVYADKNKVQGVNIEDPQEKQKIYQQYLKAFKKGVFNYIKEEVGSVPGMSSKEQGIFPRKYFSGGYSLLTIGDKLKTLLKASVGFIKKASVVTPLLYVLGCNLGSSTQPVQTTWHDPRTGEEIHKVISYDPLTGKTLDTLYYDALGQQIILKKGSKAMNVGKVIPFVILMGIVSLNVSQDVIPNVIPNKEIITTTNAPMKDKSLQYLISNSIKTINVLVDARDLHLSAEDKAKVDEISAEMGKLVQELKQTQDSVKAKALQEKIALLDLKLELIRNSMKLYDLKRLPRTNNPWLSGNPKLRFRYLDTAGGFTISENRSYFSILKEALFHKPAGKRMTTVKIDGKDTPAYEDTIQDGDFRLTRIYLPNGTLITEGFMFKEAPAARIVDWIKSWWSSANSSVPRFLFITNKAGDTTVHGISKIGNVKGSGDTLSDLLQDAYHGMLQTGRILSTMRRKVVKQRRKNPSSEIVDVSYPISVGISPSVFPNSDSIDAYTAQDRRAIADMEKQRDTLKLAIDSLDFPMGIINYTLPAPDSLYSSIAQDKLMPDSLSNMFSNDSLSVTLGQFALQIDFFRQHSELYQPEKDSSDTSINLPRIDFQEILRRQTKLLEMEIELDSLKLHALQDGGQEVEMSRSPMQVASLWNDSAFLDSVKAELNQARLTLGFLNDSLSREVSPEMRKLLEGRTAILRTRIAELEEETVWLDPTKNVPGADQNQRGMWPIYQKDSSKDGSSFAMNASNPNNLVGKVGRLSEDGHLKSMRDNSKAMIQRRNGGIDFNTDKRDFLQINNQNGEIRFRIDPAMLAQFESSVGFEPQITTFQPMTNLPRFLGLNQEDENIKLAKA